MKLILPTTLCALLTALPVSASVLAVGESWSGLEDFQLNDASGTGTNGLSNTGTNGNSFDVNSQGGKFVTNGSGLAVTSGDAGSWTRFFPGNGSSGNDGQEDRYATPYGTGKFRIEFVLGGYDFTNHAVAVNGQDQFELNLRDGSNTVIAGLRLRIKDSDGNGLADQFQTHHLGVNPDRFSGNLGVDSSAGSNISSMAIEFDFDNDTIFYERNGNIFAGTGVSGSDLGAFTANNFNQLTIGSDGTWGTSGTFLNTDSFTLYTAVPEPSGALLALLGLLGLLHRRR
ncbi:hypothetical protein [Haloferula rosea]|uniref:PEP-CTERM protein-sorting domain-containing protein n=1 Tax=Haloferula rosea TaxID=490093 RepID=A0A934V9W7_9BACT|nr:hypothetical protein [Haloferula rosea]MBK1825678.1 hypothetical protein [Haloferula rosea]